MNKNEIIQILHDWNFWEHPVETGFERSHYLSQLKNFLTTPQVIAITGPRRSGKSFLMRRMAQTLLTQGIPKNHILMVNLEDPRFTQLNTKLLDQIYSVYLEFLAPQGQSYLFLDEIQEIDQWEKWVRYLNELKKAKVVISGSNAKLLSRELGTLLTGRHLDLTIFPLSFKEYLQFNGLPFSSWPILREEQIAIQGHLRRYIEFGGFPEVVLSEPKKEILLGYFDDIVNKDLLKRFKIRKSEKLKSLVKYYLSNMATLSTFNSMEKFLQISADTVEKFSNYLEQVYLIFFLKRFSFKVKEQEKSPRKVYSIDTGLSNMLGFRFSENRGKMLENIVFLELKRRLLADSSLQLYYWKDLKHREVDFVIKQGPAVKTLIQVCLRLDDLMTKDREIKSLLKGMEELQPAEALVITEDFESQETIEGKQIQFVPLGKWLLA